MYEKTKNKNKILFISNSKNTKKIFNQIRSFYEIKKLILNIFEVNFNINKNTNLEKERIKEIVLLNLFFSFYEDSSRDLINFNIENLFFNHNYNILNFKMKNESGYNLQMPENETYFSILKNSSYHKSFRNEDWINNWDKWIKNNSSKIQIYINDFSINKILKNDEEMFLRKIIQLTNKKIRDLYDERNDVNHSFDKWFNKDFKIFENSIFALFILLVMNLTIFDFYLNDCWKNNENTFSIKKDFPKLQIDYENEFVVNEFYSFFKEFINEDITSNNNILRIKIEFIN